MFHVYQAAVARHRQVERGVAVAAPTGGGEGLDGLHAERTYASEPQRRVRDFCSSLSELSEL